MTYNLWEAAIRYSWFALRKPSDSFWCASKQLLWVGVFAALIIPYSWVLKWRGVHDLKYLQLI